MKPFWDARVADWVAYQIWGDGPAFRECQALGVAHKGQLVAGLVFHDWNPRAQTIEISAAAVDRRWASRTVINEALTYAFDRVGSQAVMARHAENNAPARKLWEALGAQEVIVPRMYGQTENGAVAVLTKEAWGTSRFRRVQNGQKQRANAA